MQYKFKQEDPDMLYKPNRVRYSFYQICGIQNPHTNKFTVRKLIFDEYQNIVKEYVKEYDKKTIQKFIKHKKNNKYKMYSTCDLSIIGYPRADEILNANSSLLNKNYDDYGYEEVDYL